MSESAVSKAERRQAPRTKLVEIAYIGMGPENGGLVLDVSDGGLSFHSVAPVMPAETIHFLLSLQGHSRIEGAGEVVWTNEMRTVCGLRFISLSSGAREYLNNWTNQSRATPAPREKTYSHAPLPPLQNEDSSASLASQSEAGSEPVFAIPPAPEFYLSGGTAGSIWRNPVFFWMTVGLLGAVFAVAGFLYGVHVGKSETNSADQPAINSDAQPEPPTIEPAPIPVPSAATDASPAATLAPAPIAATNIPNAAPSSPDGALVNASKTNVASGNSLQLPSPAKHPANVSDPQHADEAAEAGKSELAAALADLNGDNGKRDSAAAVKLLWAAVANGNSAAEVILSDLYVSGDGVAKNCEQGRVLLVAAAKTGDAQAKVKLDELNANGCQ
jgi:hypothetical protein